jgi:putative transposase
MQVLRTIASERPTATLEEVARELHARTGVRVCTATVRKALRTAGIRKVRPLRAVAAPPADDSILRRYGYTAAHRREEADDRYPSCLTDAEWALVADLFERPSGSRGLPARIERRLLVDACCYVLRTGCAWRLLPTSFPPWPTVYKTFSRWAAQGRFEQMHDRLREQWRLRIGRNAQPSAAIIDSQSTRASPQGGPSGFDAGKKVKGRKRHLVVDTLGVVLAVTVTAASVQDRDAAPAVVAQACAKLPSLKALFADAAYAGVCAEQLRTAHSLDVQIVRHPANRVSGVFANAQQALWPLPPPAAFVVQAKRWVVERTHAWNERCRRLIMHHDRSTSIACTWVWLAEARILLARLVQDA